jgi:hypothetical protein
LNSSFRNSLFYNRGKQTIWPIHLQNKTKNLLSIGSQEATNNSINTIQPFVSKVGCLVFLPKQFRLLFNLRIFQKKLWNKRFQLAPKSVICSLKNTSWDIFMNYKVKNQIESSKYYKTFWNRFSYVLKKITLNGEVSFTKINLKEMSFLQLGFKCSRITNRTKLDLDCFAKKYHSILRHQLDKGRKSWN